MGDITLSTKGQRKLRIVTELACEVITDEEAMQLLGCCLRTVKRLRLRHASEGAACVVHGNEGRAPAHKTPSSTLTQITALAGEDGRYEDLNTTHMHGLLKRREGIEVGRSTLDRMLKDQGVRKRTKGRKRRVFRRRERSSRMGFMLLIDGSLHDWLEGRGPKMCLIGAIDDATGTVVHLRFWPTECLAGYLRMLRDVTGDYGVPEALYHDKHTILCSPLEPTIQDELEGTKPQSQFEQVLDLLGVSGIKAHTPQAKGRVERLWGTLQDRLVKELRLAGACTIEAANAFLAPFLLQYNQEFALAPLDENSAWEAMPKDADSAYYFAARQQRVVRKNHTISWSGRTLQIRRSDLDPSLADKKVSVHLDPEGNVFIYHGKQRLAYKEVSAQPAVQPHVTAEVGAVPDKPRRKASDNAGTRAWLYART